MLEDLKSADGYFLLPTSYFLRTQEKMMLEDLKSADGCSVDEYAAALEKVREAERRDVWSCCLVAA